MGELLGFMLVVAAISGAINGMEELGKKKWWYALLIPAWFGFCGLVFWLITVNGTKGLGI